MDLENNTDVLDLSLPWVAWWPNRPSEIKSVFTQTHHRKAIPIIHNKSSKQNNAIGWRELRIALTGLHKLSE